MRRLQVRSHQLKLCLRNGTGYHTALLIVLEEMLFLTCSTLLSICEYLQSIAFKSLSNEASLSENLHQIAILESLIRRRFSGIPYFGTVFPQFERTHLILAR